VNKVIEIFFTIPNYFGNIFYFAGKTGVLEEKNN